MKLDGKKKWTAAIMAIAGTVATQFAPEQENAIMEIAQSAAPMLIGGIYIIAQWWHDDKKEIVKVEHERTEQVKAHATEEMVELRQVIQPILEDLYFDPFDAEAFEKKLDTRAARAYLQVDPITRYFAAIDRGRVTPCQHIDQAVAYWDFLLTKAREAFSFMFGFPYLEADQHLGDNASCPYYSVDNMARQKGIHTWNMLLGVRRAERKLQEIEGLVECEVDWQAKIGKQDQTLYGLGERATILLKEAL